MCHSLYDDYVKENLAEYELGDAYEERYPEYMKNGFPPSRYGSLEDKYYRRGQEIFYSFEGLNPQWEIIDSEIEVELEINGRKFVGYIDLLVRDKSTRRLIVVDHKSKSKFKSKEEEKEYAIQLYLYAEWVYEHYGDYPQELVFNMFRVGTEVHIPFDKKDLDAAINWFTSTIDAIYADCDFFDKIAVSYEKINKPLNEYKRDDFFCNYLCGSRESCIRNN